MIGSSTLVVKYGNNNYRVHILGGVILGDVKIGEFIKIAKKYQDKPDADNLSEKDVYQILSSTQCASKHRPNYSDFAGDRKWFLDLSSKSLINIEEFVKNWNELHKEEIETDEILRVKTFKKNQRDYLKKIKNDAKIFTEELFKVIDGTSTISYQPEIGDGYEKVTFKQGEFNFSKSRKCDHFLFFTPSWGSESYELFKGKFNYIDYLIETLKKSKWKVTTIKMKWYCSITDEKTLVAFFAKKNGITLYWNCQMKNDLSLVTTKSYA